MINFFNLKNRKIILGFFLTLLLTACNNSSHQITEELAERNIQGKLIDSAVQGVEYRCGDIIDITTEMVAFHVLHYLFHSILVQLNWDRSINLMQMDKSFHKIL